MNKDKKLAMNIAKKVDEKGGKTFFVGGFVRDSLLGISSKDIDIEVHGLNPSELKEILSSFGQPTENGKSFGVFGLKGHDLDIAMPRKEICVGEKHTDFIVDVDPHIGERNAAKRRDFTINALMMDVLTGEVLDFFGGKEDLSNGIIRHIDDASFVEDPLRVLRAAQFAARFNFGISEDTKSLCKNISLKSLSKERIFGETEKALLKAKKPSIFFKELRNVDQLGFWFPEVKALIGVPQNKAHHQEGDVWNHTMLVLDEAAKRRAKTSNQIAFMLSALCHDFGKAVCTVKDTDGRVRAIGHEKLGLPLVQAFLSRLASGKKVVNFVLNMVELHQQPNQIANDKARVKASNKMFDKSISPKDLVSLSVCDGLGKIPAKENQDFLLNRLDLFNKTMSKPFVRGQDLIEAGLTPGKRFATLLAHAHKLRLAGVDKATALKQVVAMNN